MCPGFDTADRRRHKPRNAGRHWKDSRNSVLLVQNAHVAMYSPSLDGHALKYAVFGETRSYYEPAAMLFARLARPLRSRIGINRGFAGHSAVLESPKPTDSQLHRW